MVGRSDKGTVVNALMGVAIAGFYDTGIKVLLVFALREIGAAIESAFNILENENVISNPDPDLAQTYIEMLGKAPFSIDIVLFFIALWFFRKTGGITFLITWIVSHVFWMKYFDVTSELAPALWNEVVGAFVVLVILSFLWFKEIVSQIFSS